jgi:hypothetical protein
MTFQFYAFPIPVIFPIYELNEPLYYTTSIPRLKVYFFRKSKYVKFDQVFLKIS